MKSIGIAVKETIRNQYESRKKFRKLGFEEIISKSTLYLLVNFLRYCVCPRFSRP